METKEVTEIEQNKLEAIAEMKEALDKSVPKEEYEKVLQENKKLLTDYVNRRPAPKQESTLSSAKEYADKLKNMATLTNRQFIETSVNYRDAMLKEVGKDPWSDNGEVTADTAKVAETFKALLAEIPDDFTFRTTLHNVMRDDANLIARLRSGKRK